MSLHERANRRFGNKKLARPMNTIFEIWEKILDEVVQSCFDYLKQYLPRVIEVDGALASRTT